MSAGGTDTARGISFQHAQAVAACLDLLESPDAELLQVEGREDVVDFELRTANGQRLRVCQAKTRQEPYTWGPAAIVAIIGEWQKLKDAGDAQFEFLTDGSAGKELANKLQPALRRARKGQLTSEDEDYLRSKGLTPQDPLLPRVVIASRQPGADMVLDRVMVRLLRLLEMVDKATTQRAEALINALFRLVSLRSGLDDADERVITRQELAEMLEVPLAVIDAAQQWDATTRQAHVEALRKDLPHPSFVPLEAEPVSLHPEALALVVREEAESVDVKLPMRASEVLAEGSGAVISGPPGAGKSTTIELLVPAALDRDLLPVALRVEGFEAGSLRRLIREALERSLGYPLAPGAALGFLSENGATLLLDGAGELGPEVREGLVADLQDLARGHSHVRAVLTSRNAANLRALALPSYVLQGLDHELRRRIAKELLNTDDDSLVRDVEDRLGDVVDNPLLFVMALSLAKEAVPADSRVELFDGFMEGMAARPEGGAVSDLALAVLRDVCFVLRERDAYSLDRWSWLQLAAAALQRLAEAKLFNADAGVADDVLKELQAVGLLRVLPSSGLLALTHDLFCDFFAAEAVRRQQRVLPEDIGPELEEATVFLAERGGLTGDDARRASSNPVAAARAAAASPLNSAVDDAELTERYRELLQHLGLDLQEPLAEVHIMSAVLPDGVYLFVLPPTVPSDAGLEPNLAAVAALRVARVPHGAGSLAAAVALWLAELRTALDDHERGELLPIPRQREGLPAALSRGFETRKGYVETLFAQVCPALSDRGVRELGFRGFHACVLPPVTQTLPIGGGQELTDHPMAFSFNAADVEVRLADPVDDDFVGAPSTNIGAEDWLREAPLQAALNDVRKTLERLLPGLAR